MRSRPGSAVVVMMANVLSQASGSSSGMDLSRQNSYNPAIAIGRPSLRWMKKGCLRGLPLASSAVGLTCHSYQPSAGTRQRREAAALANEGLSSTDSARALVIRSPTLTSPDQLGTSPHVSRRSCRTGAATPCPREARVRLTGRRALWSRQDGAHRFARGVRLDVELLNEVLRAGARRVSTAHTHSLDTHGGPRATTVGPAGTRPEEIEMTVVRRIARPMLAAVFVSGGLDTLLHPGARAKIAAPLVARLSGPLNLPDDPEKLARDNGAKMIE